MDFPVHVVEQTASAASTMRNNQATMKHLPTLSSGISAAAAAAGGLVGVSDALSLRDENIALKRRIHALTDREKILCTKLARLTEDLQRLKQGERPLHQDKDEINLLQDLRQRLEASRRENATLKNKLSHMSALQEANSRKPRPYDAKGVTKSVQSIRKLIPTWLPRQKQTDTTQERYVSEDQLTDLSQETPDWEVQKEEIKQQCLQEAETQFEREREKMNDIVHMLRTQLQIKEGQLAAVQKEYASLIDQKQRTENDLALTLESERGSLIQADIERIHLQTNLVAAEKKIEEMAIRIADLEAKNEATTRSYNETMQLLASTNEDLKKTRISLTELESKSLKEQVAAASESQLTEMLADLREEKSLIEKAHNDLIASLLNNEREKKFNSVKQDLQEQIQKLKEELAHALDQHSKTIHGFQSMKDEMEILVADRDRALKLHDVNLKELQTVQEQLDFILKDGGKDARAVREALAIVRARQERGVNDLPFLNTVENAIEEKEILQKLRSENMSLHSDLETLRNVIKIQEIQTAQKNTIIGDLEKEMERLRSEYELRIEENARVLDVRAQRINQLESRLKKFQYTPFYEDDHDDKKGKIVQKSDPEQLQYCLDLDPGETVLEIRIIQSTLFPNSSTSLEDTPTGWATFVSVDFGDWETVVSGLSFGETPHHPLLAIFKMTMNEESMYHLSQPRALVMELHRAHGNLPETIAFFEGSLKGLIDLSTTDTLHFKGIWRSIEDPKIQIGTVEYCVRLHVPVVESWRVFESKMAWIGHPDSLESKTNETRSPVKDAMNSRRKRRSVIPERLLISEPPILIQTLNEHPNAEVSLKEKQEKSQKDTDHALSIPDASPRFVTEKIASTVDHAPSDIDHKDEENASRLYQDSDLKYQHLELHSDSISRHSENDMQSNANIIQNNHHNRTIAEGAGDIKTDRLVISVEENQSYENDEEASFVSFDVTPASSMLSLMSINDDVDQKKKRKKKKSIKQDEKEMVSRKSKSKIKENKQKSRDHHHDNRSISREDRGATDGKQRTILRDANIPRNHADQESVAPCIDSSSPSSVATHHHSPIIRRTPVPDTLPAPRPRPPIPIDVSSFTHGENGLVVIIEEGMLDMSLPHVYEPLMQVGRAFVAMELMDYDLEDLESEGMVPDMNTGRFAWNFGRFFPIDPINDTGASYSCTRCLRSAEPARRSLTVTVVAEPSDPRDDCIDLAWGRLDLAAVIRQVDQESKRQAELRQQRRFESKQGRQLQQYLQASNAGQNEEPAMIIDTVRLHIELHSAEFIGVLGEQVGWLKIRLHGVRLLHSLLMNSEL